MVFPGCVVTWLVNEPIKMSYFSIVIFHKLYNHDVNVAVLQIRSIRYKIVLYNINRVPHFVNLVNVVMNGNLNS